MPRSKKLPDRTSTISARPTQRDTERVRLNEENNSFKLDGCCI